MIPILVTAMICSTLMASIFILSYKGIDIRINRNLTYKDLTEPPEPKETSIDIDKEEDDDLKDVVETTVDTMNDYFKEEDDGGRKQKEVERA